MTAMVLSKYVFKKRLTISSVTEDFPAPPVPVMPNTAPSKSPPLGETFATAPSRPPPTGEAFAASLIFVSVLSMSWRMDLLFIRITLKPSSFSLSVRCSSFNFTSGI